MELQKTKHQIKLEQWRNTILECRSSGMPVRTWCQERQINTKTYYRWEKEIWATANQEMTSREHSLPAVSNPSFAEVSVAREAPYVADQPSSIILRFGTNVMEIRNGVDPVLLQNIIRMLGQL